MSLKVLHIVEALDRGAVENWLLRMYRHARRRSIDLDWTFYCVLEQPGKIEDEVRNAGAKVMHSPVPISRKLEFVRGLRRAMREGRYDVLHCHHDLISAVYLMAALGMPFSRRIVHVHNADGNIPSPNIFKQILYRASFRRLCLTMADKIVGISNIALDSFLAGRDRRIGRDVVHYYGIDPGATVHSDSDRKEFRSSLAVPESARILLFAGRMVQEKNPLFAIDVLDALRGIDPAVVGVFVGAGSMENAIRSRVNMLGLDGHFRALGWRDDVAAIMRCSDWFVLPRPETPQEGFGIAVVEAQLAGLRLLLSRGITDDPLLPGAVFRRLSLSDSPAQWAQAAEQLLAQPAPSPEAALRALRNSPMDMDRALDGLMGLYA